MSEAPDSRCYQYLGLTAEKIDKLVAECAHGAAYVFAVNKWTWGLAERQCIPDEADIASTLRRLIDDLEPGNAISSGRLTVEHHVEDDFDCVNVSMELGSVETERHP